MCNSCYPRILVNIVNVDEHHSLWLVDTMHAWLNKCLRRTTVQQPPDPIQFVPAGGHIPRVITHMCLLETDIGYCHCCSLNVPSFCTRFELWMTYRRIVTVVALFIHHKCWLYPVMYKQAVLLSRTWAPRTRTTTWKLVLEDPRGQGLSSRTTTL